MTQSREVLAMMDAHTTTFGRKRGCTISRSCGFFLFVLFVLGLVLTGLLVYHFGSCADGGRSFGSSQDNEILDAARSFATHGPIKKKINVRLPHSIKPNSYDIKLMPFIWEKNFTFNGEVRINISVLSDTKNITLHAADMKIDEAATTVTEINNDNSLSKSVMILEQMNDTAREFHVVQTDELLKAGKQYLVYLKFVGHLNDHLQGFYRSSYTVGNQTRWIATTQFQATDARRAFPCFDEPSLKARFTIHIARPNNMTSISNMPRIGDSEPAREISTYVWDHYEQSVPMSTYLVAFIVSDFEFIKSPTNNFTIWARQEAISQARYSLNIGPRILKYYEDFFQIKFPLPKIDMVALPDFAAGAMENWGLITYRETAVLYKEGISASSNQHRVATVIAHELAHQWFGNLVTPTWWTDLWLNEGFANYVEYLGMNSVEPEWKVLDQFVIYELQNVFTLDDLASSHPISIEVGHPDEIDEIFDRISYAKGASVIRMMHHFLTNEVFRQGLTNYLNLKAYGSAEQNDLWDALTKQAHTKENILPKNVTIKQIMDTWTLQTGFPVVTVTRDYINGGATLKQKRFIMQNISTNVDPIWWVPITYTTQGAKNFSNTQPSHWMKAEKTLILKDLGASADEWTIFNIQETGFYRVNYDAENWHMIIKQLKGENYKDISTINRGQLIDDALNLARAGLLDYKTALDITSYLVQETEFVPWKSAFTAMSYLDNMLNKYQGYDRFRVYILELLNNIYQEVGFKDNRGDQQLTVFTRVDVLSWACMFSHRDCVKNALEQFKSWMNQPDPDSANPISPNLKSVVYCTAIRVGGYSEWNFAWDRYLKTNVGSEKDLLLYALGCSREPWILSRYLEWAISNNTKIRRQDSPRVFAAVSSNAIGQPIVFSFLRNQWPRLREYFGTSLTSINSIVKLATRRINSEYELKDLLEFAEEHKNELGSATRSIQQSIEQVEANIRWLKRNYESIRDWMRENTAEINN